MKLTKHALLAAFLFIGGSAVLAADTPAGDSQAITVEISNLRVTTGHLLATLCPDPASFMRACSSAHTARANADRSTVELTFNDVAAGTYALSAYHDANDNGKLDIGIEGYGFGNNATYPPNFTEAAIKVVGATTAHIKLQYLSPAASSTDTPADIDLTQVREQGLVAELYAPKVHASRLPTIIALSGADGSLAQARLLGRAFAQNGYAVLALAYWREETLPKTLQEIPLEYFKTAIDWLQTQPSIDPNRIGILGHSKGAEAALLLATHYPAIKAVVAVAPTYVVWPGISFGQTTGVKSSWTWNGKPVPFAPLTTATTTAGSYADMFANNLVAADTQTDALIPVENINGPVLLISGTDDKILPSTIMAERIVARLQAHRFKYTYQHLSYAGAGHMAYIGSAIAPADFNAFTKMMGGTEQGNAAAWADSWPKTLAFFDAAFKH